MHVDHLATAPTVGVVRVGRAVGGPFVQAQPGVVAGVDPRVQAVGQGDIAGPGVAGLLGLAPDGLAALGAKVRAEAVGRHDHGLAGVARHVAANVQRPLAVTDLAGVHTVLAASLLAHSQLRISISNTLSRPPGHTPRRIALCDGVYIVNYHTRFVKRKMSSCGRCCVDVTLCR